jgi:hypothetical protein
MYRRQINNALDDIIGAAEMYKFLYDEFGQLDTQKLSDHIADALGKLYQIELKIKTRPDNSGASTLINTNIT